MAYAAALGGAASWAVARFAPNLANLVRKLWQTRKIKMPSYKGVTNVKATTQVGFTKKGVPYQQSYEWTSKLGGIKYQAPVLKRTAAKFLPKGTEVSSSIFGEKLKEGGKFFIAGATGTALGLASQQRKDTTGPANVRTRQFKAVRPKPVAPMKVNVEGVATTRGPQVKIPSKVITKATKATTAKPAGATWTSPSGKKFNYSDQSKLRGMGIAHSQGKIGKTVAAYVPKKAGTSTVTTPTKAVSGPKKELTSSQIRGRSMGKAAAAAIRRFGITPKQVQASDVAERKRLLAYRGGTIAGPKPSKEFVSPFAGDIAKKQASGYHIFKKGSKGALSFREAYKKAGGKRFKWKGTGKWYK